MYIRKTLNNGLRIICEKIPYVKTVSVGVWSGVGSRMETLANNGISHFAEHMMFKGTGKRTAKMIAEEMDSIGGYLNAFTARECTCYYARAIDSCLEKIMDVLSDMYINSSMSEDNIELERKVVTEEIYMYEDSPEDIALDRLAVAAWGDSSVALPVSGDMKSVSSIGKKDLDDFALKYYNANNTVLSVAGSFDENKLFELAEKYFGKMRSGESYTEFGDVTFRADRLRREKDIEQTHLCIGFPAVISGDENYVVAALNNIVGSGMSSRLFQKIREDRGLVYSVYSAHEELKNAGLYYIYAGMSPKNTDEVRSLIEKEIKLLRCGISDEEFERAKAQLKGAYTMNLENINARMNFMGRNELMQDDVKTPEQVLKSISQIKKERIVEMINKIFSTEYAESIVENGREE